MTETTSVLQASATPEAQRYDSQPYTPQADDPQQGASLSSDERSWAAIGHLASLINLLGIPSPLGPLVVWLIKRNESSFAAEQAKASLNFALSVWIYGAAFLVGGVILLFANVLVGMFMAIALFALFGLLLLASMIFSVIGAVKASNGEAYSYPFVLELIS